MFEIGARGGARRWMLGEQLVTLFVLAALFNYPWELAQSPFYMGMGNLNRMWWHCLVASLADGLLVLLIFAAGWTALHRQDWFVRPGLRGYVVMLAVGLIISVIIEWTAVHIAGRWTYTERMPLVPGLGIGVLPIMQMLVLPPLIFRVAAAWYRVRRSSRARQSRGRSKYLTP